MQVFSAFTAGRRGPRREVMRMRAHDAMAVGTTALFDVEVNFDLEALERINTLTLARNNGLTLEMTHKYSYTC